MKRIIIVQHCQSEHHVNDLTGGWTDTPLTDLGKEQANLVAKELRQMGLEDFYLISSDLKRAYMTAEVIEKEFNVNIITNQELREYNNGDAANKTKDWSNKHKQRTNGIMSIDAPLWKNAETFRELFQRMEKFQKQNLRDLEKDIVIVSHGLAIGYMIMSWLGLEAEKLPDTLLQGKAGGISVLSHSMNNQNTLQVFNSLGHLKDL